MLRMRIYTFTVKNLRNGNKRQFSLELDLSPQNESLGKQACKIMDEYQHSTNHEETVVNYQLLVKMEDNDNYVLNPDLYHFMEEMADYMRMEIINN